MLVTKYTRGDVELRTVEGLTLEVRREGESDGIVEAIVSVFGVVDWYNDVIQPGAFVKTITERLGDMVVLDNHRTASTLDVIGSFIEAREVGRDGLPESVQNQYPEATGGLYVKFRLDLDTPEGMGVYLRLKKGSIKKYSIGFNIVKSTARKFKTVRDGVEREVMGRLITEIRLWEISPVIFPANEATATVAVKALDGTDIEGSPSEVKASLSQQVSDVVTAFDLAGGDHDYYYVREVFADYIVVKSLMVDAYHYYRVNYSYDPDSGDINFASYENWTGGNYVFVEGQRSIDMTAVGEVLGRLEKLALTLAIPEEESDAEDPSESDPETHEAEPSETLTSVEEIRARILSRIALLDQLEETQ